MDETPRAQLIEQYRSAWPLLAEIVAAVPKDRFDGRPSPDEWSPRQVIHHLADAELRSTVRLRQLLAEDEPLIQGYEEERYTERLPIDRSIQVSLDAVRISREANLELLDRVAPSDWERAGTHTESGRYGLEDWLRIYTAHPLDHADQIRRAAS